MTVLEGEPSMSDEEKEKALDLLNRATERVRLLGGIEIFNKIWGYTY